MTSDDRELKYANLIFANIVKHQHYHCQKRLLHVTD